MGESFKGYEYSLIDGGVRIERCTLRIQNLTIPEFIEGMPITTIAPYAFERNADVREIVCPSSVMNIGSRAFANCPELVRISFPASLARYENSWITGCERLEEIVLPGAIVDLDLPFPSPASVKRICIGELTRTVQIEETWKTKLDQVSVHPGNPWLSSDGTCIYNADGTELVLHATKAPEVVVAERCRKVGPRAFEREKHLERVHLPEGVCEIDERAFAESSLCSFEPPHSLRVIGREAFMRCEHLRSVELPPNLQRVEARAFATTALTTCIVPASVEHLGECALAFNFKNWHPTTNPPEARAHVSLEPGNTRYFIERGLLYERGEDDAPRVVLYVGPDIDVIVPDNVRSIAPYAFFGVQGIRELRLPAKIATGEATFAMRKPPAHIVLEVDDGITFEPMHDWRGVCALQRAFAGDGTTNVQLMCATFDEEALSAQLDYEVYRYMLERLARPQHLEASRKQAFECVLREHLADACIAFARHDDRAHIDVLADIGFISADNIDFVVEAVSPEGSAPIMARLHELKRTRFQASGQDYEL